MHDQFAWRSDITERVGILEQDIGEIKQSNAGIVQSLADMKGWMEGVSRDIRDNRKPLNWVGIVALLALIVTVLGGYTNMTISPVKEAVSQLDIKLQKEASMSTESIKISMEAVNTISKERHDASQESIARLRDDFVQFYQHGSPELRERTARMETMMEHLAQDQLESRADIKRLEGVNMDQLEKNAYARGVQAGMEQHIQNIDKYGSRYWINKPHSEKSE